MNAQTLISTLFVAHATDSQEETYSIVLGKLKDAQKNKALPQVMIRRALRIMKRMNVK